MKGSYKRVKDDRNKEELADDDKGWRFKLSNAHLRRITGTCAVMKYCIQKHLKYLAHICRMDNDDVRKHILLDERAPKWTALEKHLGMDAQQIRRTMMNRTNF